MGVLGRTMTVEVVKDITPTGEIVLSGTTIPANGILHYEGYKTIRLVREDETDKGSSWGKRSLRYQRGALCLVTLSVKSLR